MSMLKGQHTMAGNELERVPAYVKTAKITAGGVEVLYVTSGHGPHHVLCIPPLFMTWEIYLPILKHFDREQFTVVSWDPPGVCRSESVKRNIGTHSFAENADYAVELMEALGVARFSVLGMCGGGRSGAVLAARHRSRVHKLVLANTSAFYTQRDAEVVREMMADLSSWKGPIAHLTFSAYGGQHNMQRAITEAGFLQTEGDICSGCLKDIHCPTLIVAGAQDKVLSDCHFQHLQENIQGCEAYLHENAGHSLMWSHPEDFCRRVQDFLLKP